jgi:hypothetical protein
MFRGRLDRRSLLSDGDGRLLRALVAGSYDAFEQILDQSDGED